MLLFIVLLAVGSSRKRTRQFKLQMLHGQTFQQQQQIIQPVAPNSASEN
jgi:hypothetical protein